MIFIQEDIDNQNKRYSDDYLFSAKVGDLVWAGDGEVFLSLSNIEDKFNIGYSLNNI